MTSPRPSVAREEGRGDSRDTIKDGRRRRDKECGTRQRNVNVEEGHGKSNHGKKKQEKRRGMLHTERRWRTGGKKWRTREREEERNSSFVKDHGKREELNKTIMKNGINDLRQEWKNWEIRIQNVFQERRKLGNKGDKYERLVV